MQSGCVYAVTVWESPDRDHVGRSRDNMQRDAYTAPNFSSVPLPTAAAPATIWEALNQIYQANPFRNPDPEKLWAITKWLLF